MGLKIWLPLNGNTNNQGHNNGVRFFSNSGATVNTAGKIGKCYNFDGVDDWMRFTINKHDYDNKPITMACWFKSDQKNTAGCILDLAADLCLSYSISSGKLYFNYWRVYGTTSRIGDSHATTTGYDINKWHHIAVVFDKTTNYIYVDGELSQQWNSASQNYWVSMLADNYNTFNIGRSHGNSTSWIDGKVNDVRLYDHCLSPEEIKHISQGLTLHYSLSNRGFGGDNLLKNSHVKLDNKNYYVGTYAFADSSKLVTGKTYTLSFNGELQDDSQTGWYFNIFPSPYTAVINNYTEKKGRFAFSFVMPENGGNRTSIGCYSLPLGNYKGCAIWNVKLEEGDHATPWIPNSADALYSSLGLNSTAELDCSGYQYNGIKNNVTNDTDSPVNKGCYVFNGTNSWIKCDTNEWMVQGATELTINEWAYTEDWTTQTNAHLFSCTESGGFNTESAGSGYLRFPRHVYTNEAKSSSGYEMSNTAINLADLMPGWHMFTFVYNTSGDKIYIDGELYSSYDVVSYGLHFNTNARLYLGCEANSANPYAPYFNGKLSDFRLYYTELNEDEIKELYRMGK